MEKCKRRRKLQLLFSSKNWLRFGKSALLSELMVAVEIDLADGSPEVLADSTPSSYSGGSNLKATKFRDQLSKF